MKTLYSFLIVILILSGINNKIIAQCTFTNPGFETWQIDDIATLGNDTVHYENPTDWVSFVDQFGAAFSSSASAFIPKVNKTTDKNSGTYAVRLDANGDESSDLEAYGYCNNRPNTLTGYFKYNGSTNDSLLINAYMINEDPVNFIFSGDTSTSIGKGSFLFMGNQSAYQQFTININYKSSALADTFVIQVANINSNSASPSTSAFLDDFDLFLSNSVDEINQDISLELYPNPNEGNFTISFSDLHVLPQQIEIFNSVGQIVYSKEIASQKFNVELDQPSGIYFARINTNKGMVVKRIIIN